MDKKLLTNILGRYILYGLNIYKKTTGLLLVLLGAKLLFELGGRVLEHLTRRTIPSLMVFFA